MNHSPNTAIGDKMAMNSMFCHVREFKPKNESILTYLERVSLFFEVNEIAKGKQVTWLLNMMGAKTYSLVSRTFIGCTSRIKEQEWSSRKSCTGASQWPPGNCRMKAISRSYAWWPGLDKAIKTRVRNCKDCQVVKQTPPKAPLHPWV